MRMMDELKPLYLYSAQKRVYAPIDVMDKRRNSAILLLTPDMETSSRLMQLPYIYKSDLFNSFYIDRNVMAYIDNVGANAIDFDPEEEEKLSEAALIPWTKKTKIKFHDGISMMDKKYCEEIINSRNIVKQIRALGIGKMPEEIVVEVHPTAIDLQKDAPNSLMKLYENRVFSYTKNNEIHIISKLSYDDSYMGGSYEIYVLNELLYALMSNYNDELHYIPLKAISSAMSGLIEWKKNNDNQIPKIDAIDNLAKIINDMLKKKQVSNITRYLNTADTRIFTKYAAKTVIKDLYSVIFEAELSYFERQRLLPSEFGIPDKRKYPMPNEEHVIAAIRMFNHCDPDDEEELAEAIIKRINRFGIKNVKVSASNRFYKYYKKAIQDKKIVPKNEAVVLESFCNSEYEDVLKICSHMSKDEFDRISFYDTYRDSQFIVKRFIKRVGGEPAGFLDVYHFPSKPEIAQIVIGVDDRFRGQGIADSLVKEMLNANLPERFGFTVYYWTAHPDNIGSIKLAMKNGFHDTDNIDKHGRKIFLKINNNEESIWNAVINELGPDKDSSYSLTENSLISHDLALFNEADNEKAYSQRIRKYLYSERLKNAQAVATLYNDIKATNPEIRRTYPKIKLYKKFNTYIDLSYYNGLFLQKNTYKLDKAVNFYFDFINRLINNKEISNEYKMRTIFIPIDSGVWCDSTTDITDFRRTINPISIIFRLLRTNQAALKKEWGNKQIIFVGSRGYFTIDFNKIEIKDMTRIKTNLRKLMSVSEPVVDDYEHDELGDDGDFKVSGKTTDSHKAIAVSVIDSIEKGTGISIDNISSISTSPNALQSSHMHLRISTDRIAINKDLIAQDNGVAIISIDPDGPEGFDRLRGSLLSAASKIDTYCIPEDK